MTEGASYEDALIWRGTTPLSRAAFLREASAVAASLPPNPYIVNLCEQRETFLLLFAASVLARRTQLMPAARGETALNELRADYSDSVCLGDDDVRAWRSRATATAATISLAPRDDDLVMLGFSSGSTGKMLAASKESAPTAIIGRLRMVASKAAGAIGSVEIIVDETDPAFAIHKSSAEFTIGNLE